MIGHEAEYRINRLVATLDQVGGVESAAAPGYPSSNIQTFGRDAYNISLVVAGFARADLWDASVLRHPCARRHDA